jgi:hypothetical protein
MSEGNRVGPAACGRRAVMCVAALLVLVAPSWATSITFTGVHPSLPLSASATFDAVGTDLVVTLANIQMGDVVDPAQILTTLYFDVNGPALALSPTSAVVPAGHGLLFPGATPFDPLPNGVGGEWEYLSGVTNAPFGQDYALRSAGLGLLSASATMFPGANLEGPSGANGLQYGITTPLDNPLTGNAAVTGGAGALIQSQVVFVLGGLPANFDPSTSVKNVQWQYGTTRCDVAGTVDRCVPEVPEPASAWLLLVGGALLLHRRR